MLKIETSIASPAGSLLVNTVQVHIRIYRAAPSLAESLSGSFAGTKSTGSTSLPALNPKLLWQSAQLDGKTEGVIFVDIEVAARAVDAALDGSGVSSRARVLQQVLRTLEKKHNVKFSSKSAKVILWFAATACLWCVSNVLQSALLISWQPSGQAQGKERQPYVRQKGRGSVRQVACAANNIFVHNPPVDILKLSICFAAACLGT